MKLTVMSLALFLLSVVFLVGMTLFETAFIGISRSVERVLTLLLLVVPAATGAVLAALSLKRREGATWQAGTLLALNAMFALFYLAVVLVAG